MAAPHLSLRSPHLARALRLLAVPALVLCALLAVPASAPAATWHVAPHGSDTGAGSATAPFATIGRARDAARAGDVVEVASGRYAETVALGLRSTGVTFRGVGPSRPVLDGGGVHAYGFSSNTSALADVTIENFEVRGQVQAGIQIVGTRAVVRGNHVHHVGAPGTLSSFGVRMINGAGHRVQRNLIEEIGPGGESMGVMLVTTRDATVEGNEIRLVRKEGVRDYMGLDNVVRDNRISLTWTAIASATSTGGLITNNFLHDNVQGWNPKHTSLQQVLDHWRLPAGRWTRFHRNTVFRSSDSSVALAISAPVGDFLDVRDNVFSGAGSTFIADAPAVRGPNVVLDGNVYSTAGGRPPFVYHTGYDFKANGHRDLPALRAALGWEHKGTFVDVEPDALRTTPLPGELARDGKGATGLVAGATWTPWQLTATASSSPGTWSTTRNLQHSSDGRHHTYWMTTTPADEFVTFDMGTLRTVTHLVLNLYSHRDVRAPRRLRVEHSVDGLRWAPGLDVVNPDALGSSYKYALPAPTTTRFVRVTLVETFCVSYAPRTGCGAYFVLSELQAGFLAPGGGVPDALAGSAGAPSVAARRPVRRPVRRLAPVASRRSVSRSSARRPSVRCTVRRVRGRRNARVTCRLRNRRALRRAASVRLQRDGRRVATRRGRFSGTTVRFSVRASVPRSGRWSLRLDRRRASTVVLRAALA